MANYKTKLRKTKKGYRIDVDRDYTEFGFALARILDDLLLPYVVYSFKLKDWAQNPNPVGAGVVAIKYEGDPADRYIHDKCVRLAIKSV